MPENPTIRQIIPDKTIKGASSSSESILIPKLLNSSPEKLQNFQTVKEKSSEKPNPFLKILGESLF